MGSCLLLLLSVSFALSSAVTIFAAVFSLSDSGHVVTFDLSKPNNYTGRAPADMVEFYNFCVFVSPRQEIICAGTTTEGSFVEAWSPKLQLLRSVPFPDGSIVVEDLQVGGDGVLYGIFANSSSFFFGSLDAVSCQVTTLMGYPEGLDMLEEDTSAFDPIHLTYYVNSWYDNRTCGWLQVDLRHASWHNYPMVCTSSTFGVANTEFVSGRVVGIANDATVVSFNPNVGSMTSLFNASSTLFRVLGASCTSKSLYVTQLSSHVPTTQLLAVDFSKQPPTFNLGPPSSEIVGTMTTISQ